MNSLPPDPYRALGVEKDADIAAIKTAYRKLVLKCHPDKVQDPALKAQKQDEFQRVQQAYEILSDEGKRKEYDDEVRIKKLREEFSKNIPHGSSTRPAPKTYYEYNVRTAEPPHSFSKPGAGPSPYSPYPGNPQFSTSWERDIPHRSSKPIYEEDRKARRAASYEKPRKEEDSKEERRRRKEAEEEWIREREREKRRAEREREREKEREREREREKDERREKLRERERLENKAAQEREARAREALKAEERRMRKERDKEREKRAKDADKMRRQEQEDKFRSRKPAYVEHHSESDEDGRGVSKKRPSASPSGNVSGGASGGSSSKKHADSPRRDKSARRDESPRDGDKTTKNMMAAVDYMMEKRRGSKSGGAAPYAEPTSYNSQYPNPDETWHGPPPVPAAAAAAAAPEPPRIRRPSHEDKRFQARVEVASDDEEAEVIDVSPRPPRLQKAFTSPPGAPMHMPNTSAPRTPHLPRSATMDYGSPRAPPPAPAAPSPEGGRYSAGKPERRRRGSFDGAVPAGYDEDPRPRQPIVRSYKIDEESPIPRVSESRYRASEDVCYMPGSGPSRAPFQKVKYRPAYSPDQVCMGKRYATEDVTYSSVPHAPSGNDYPPYSYAHVRA